MPTIEYEIAPRADRSWGMLGSYNPHAYKLLHQAFDGLHAYHGDHYGTPPHIVVRAGDGLLVGQFIDPKEDRIYTATAHQWASQHADETALGRRLSIGGPELPAQDPPLALMLLHTLLRDETVTRPPVYIGIGKYALGEIVIGTRQGLSDFIERGVFDPSPYLPAAWQTINHNTYPHTPRV